MLTDTELTAASGTLTAERQGLWLTRIRQFIQANTLQGFYPDLETKLATGTSLQNKILNGALDKMQLIQKGTSPTVALKGGRDGMDFSKPRDADYWINFALSALYEPTAVGNDYPAAQIVSDRMTDTFESWE